MQLWIMIAKQWKDIKKSLLYWYFPDLDSRLAMLFTVNKLSLKKDQILQTNNSNHHEMFYMSKNIDPNIQWHSIFFLLFAIPFVSGINQLTIDHCIFQIQCVWLDIIDWSKYRATRDWISGSQLNSKKMTNRLMDITNGIN